LRVNRREFPRILDPHGYAREGYDLLAPSYDVDIGSNLVGIRMRRVFQAALDKAFRPGDHVFEIGCGTGIDALRLARAGVEVVATDISEAMIAEVVVKARAEGISERVRCRALAAKDIGLLRTEFGESSFDGGYCHAGALNMEPQIAAVPASVRSLVRKSGEFVCSFINKTSLFEVVFYTALLRPRKAFRRMGNVVPIPISRKPPLNAYVVATRFYSARDVISLFDGGFSLVAVQGLQILLPPSNLTDLFALFRPLFTPFEHLEDRISTVWPMSEWGHHTILTFQRL